MEEISPIIVEKVISVDESGPKLFSRRLWVVMGNMILVLVCDCFVFVFVEQAWGDETKTPGI